MEYFAVITTDEPAFEAGWKDGPVVTLEQTIELAQERFPAN